MGTARRMQDGVEEEKGADEIRISNLSKASSEVETREIGKHFSGYVERTIRIFFRVFLRDFPRVFPSFYSFLGLPLPPPRGPSVHKEMKDVYKLREMFLRRCTDRFFRVTAVTRSFSSCSLSRSRERRLFASLRFFV